VMREPRRIASLLPSGTEMLYGLGLGDRVVAVSHECDYPPEVAGKPRVTAACVMSGGDSRQIDDDVRQRLSSGTPLYELDAAMLADLAPDLIVTQAQCDVCAIRYEDVLDAVAHQPALKDAQVLALNPMSLSEIFEDILRVGQATGRGDQARQYVAELHGRVEAVRSATSGVLPDERPRVACIEWIEPLMLAGNWVPELIEIAGGECELTQPGRHSAYVEWGRLLEFDPEVIVLMPCGFDLERTTAETQTLTNCPGWYRIAATGHQQVWAVDGNAYFNRSGPRIVDSLELLAHLIHPELVPPPQGGQGLWRQFR